MTGLLPAVRMSTDELVFRIRDGLRKRRLEGWSLTFATSIAGASKRPGWTPSPKQRAIMERLVDEARAGEPGSLVDDGDDGGGDG